MKDETVWLTLEQMTKLFKRDRYVISRHIKNILRDEEYIDIINKLKENNASNVFALKYNWCDISIYLYRRKNC